LIDAGIVQQPLGFAADAAQSGYHRHAADLSGNPSNDVRIEKAGVDQVNFLRADEPDQTEYTSGSLGLAMGFQAKQSHALFRRLQGQVPGLFHAAQDILKATAVNSPDISHKLMFSATATIKMNCQM
jgi:hypothetical protein